MGWGFSCPADYFSGPGVNLFGKGKACGKPCCYLMSHRGVKPFDGFDMRFFPGREKDYFVPDFYRARFDGAGKDPPVVVFCREFVDILQGKAERLEFFPRCLDEGIKMLK